MQVGHLADDFDDEYYRGEEEGRTEEPTEDVCAAANDQQEVALGDGDAEQEGSHEYRLVYKGSSNSFMITELSPACRYSFRIRYHCTERGQSGWSSTLVAETDAADSAHRIDFDSLSVFEKMGEGAFSIVYRGLYKKDGESEQVQKRLERLALRLHAAPP